MTALAVASDARHLAAAVDQAGDAGTTIELWRLPSRESLGPLPAPGDTVNRLAFSPDGNTLASASDDRTVRSWDLRLPRLLDAVNRDRQAAELAGTALGLIWGLDLKDEAIAPPSA